MSYTCDQHQAMQCNTMMYSPAVVHPQTFYNHDRSPQTVQPGPAGLSPVGMCNMFISGFSDCAQEAIRYLVDVEGLPLNHPMVIELQNHLYERQRIQAMKYLLENLVLQVQNSDTSHHGEHQKHCVSSSQNIHTSDDEGIDTSSIGMVVERESETANKLEVDISGNVQSSVDQSQASSEDTEQMVTELAEEIYSLLQQGDDGGSDDDEYDDIDEGFEESDH